jgi:hypothetical protein
VVLVFLGVFLGVFGGGGLHFALLVLFILCLGVFCLFPTHPHCDDRPLRVVRQGGHPRNVVLQQGFGFDQSTRTSAPNSNCTVVPARHVLFADWVRMNGQSTQPACSVCLRFVDVFLPKELQIWPSVYTYFTSNMLVQRWKILNMVKSVNKRTHLCNAFVARGIRAMGCRPKGPVQ